MESSQLYFHSLGSDYGTDQPDLPSAKRKAFLSPLLTPFTRLVLALAFPRGLILLSFPSHQSNSFSFFATRVSLRQPLQITLPSAAPALAI